MNDSSEDSITEENEEATEELSAEETDEFTSEEKPQPKQVTLSVRSLVVGTGVVLVAIALGVGGYLVGKGTGEDLDAARAQGQAAGKKAGTAKGTAQGFKAGFKKGKKKGYEGAYPAAYKESYVKAYEDAGLTPPDKNEIEVPNP